MIKFCVKIVIMMGFIMSTAHANECKPALSPQLSSLTNVKNLSDGKTYNQHIYSGDGIAFSSMQHLVKASKQKQVNELVYSTAVSLRQTTKGGIVNQITAAQLGKNQLGLTTVLFGSYSNNGANRIEAAAISFKDYCPTVWRYTDTNASDRNTSMDAFMKLVGEWQTAAGQSKGH